MYLDKSLMRSTDSSNPEQQLPANNLFYLSYMTDQPLSEIQVVGINLLLNS